MMDKPLLVTGRSYSPKPLIYGEDMSQQELDDLRRQVDLALMKTNDYPIVTNYPVKWENSYRHTPLPPPDPDHIVDP